MADSSIPLRISWVADARRAHGYLLVADDALHLVCLKDESETVAAAGKAAGRQFGLVGALISAGVSGGRELMRAKDLQALYDAQQLLPLEQRLSQHPLSRSVRRADVTSLQTGEHLAPSLLTTTGPLSLSSESPGVHEAVAAWCSRQQVPVVVVAAPKFPWKVVGLVVAAPVVLVLVYALVCVPVALTHRSAVADDLAKLAEFKRRAVTATEAIGEAVGTPLEEACGDRLTKTPVARQLSWVAKLPPEAARLAGKRVDDYPRFASVTPAFSRFSDPKFDTNDAEPRWKQEASFGHSFGRVFFSPSSWGELSKHTWVAQVSDAQLLLAAKVQHLEVKGSSGRATMTVRAVDLTSGKVACEGELRVDFPPDGRSTSVGLDFLMSQALPLGLLLPGCDGKTDGLCENPSYYARLAGTELQAPDAEVRPAPAPPKPTLVKAKATQDKATPATPVEPAPSTPAPSGAALRESIRAVVLEDRGAIRACYERALLKQPGLQGKVTVKFTIAGSGAVSSTSIESSTARNDGLEQCLQGRVRKWAFAPHGGGPLVVAYPFVFNGAN
ncbi:MAG: AgmX/PglI C-terminal domain-containing protein [Myxococcales bacterium]|nr:AgmX/PglI C-terminal domain-containing protein [Myxococcales bacterium]